MEKVAFKIELFDERLLLTAKRFDNIALTLEISKDKNDLNKICDLFLSDYIFVGYDIQGVQSSIINSLIKNRAMIEREHLSVYDIITEMRRLEFENYHGAYVEEKYMGLFKYIDLKLLGGKKYEYMFNYHRTIHEIVDNAITCYKDCEQYISFANKMSEKYHINNINMHKHKFINKMVLSKYCEILGIKESFLYSRKNNPIDRNFEEVVVFNYKTPSIINALKTNARFVEINNMRLSLVDDALKVSKGKLFISGDSEYKVLVIDASNFYPSVFIRENLFPWTMGKFYNDAFKCVFDELQNVNSDSYERKVLKLGLNAICGNIGNPKHILYDPFCKSQLYKKTKEYTLYLIDLCLQRKLDIIGVNNDAVFIKCKLDYNVKDIQSEYTLKTGINTHIDEYKAFVMYDITNYVGLCESGIEDVKGDYFIKNQNIKNFFIYKDESVEKTKEFSAFNEYVSPKQLKLFE